jgi:adenylate cyclase
LERDDLILGFRLGGRTVLPGAGTITGPDGEVHVEPRVMEVLLCLAREPGQVVPRRTFADTVWGHEHGSDESLTRSISALRNCFRDAGVDPDLIVTVPKRGYRLTTAPEPLAAAVATGAVRTVEPVGDATERPSIAVLPFANISADPENEYFSDGIAEELLNALSRVPGLRVAARTSAFSFKNAGVDAATIGARLGVDNILEGSVRKAGKHLRITAQLVSARDGYQVWSQRFDRELDDVFAVQDEISTAIVNALKMVLTATDRDTLVSPGTSNVQAYDLYLAARHHMHRRTPESLDRAITLFRRAAGLDPRYALAYAGIATATALLIEYGELPVAESARRATEPILKALELGPDLAETHAAVGLLRWFQLDLMAAGGALRRAVELNPDDALAHMWLGNVLTSEGRLNEGYREFRLVHELDPLNQPNNRNTAINLQRMGRTKECAACLERTLEIDPDDIRAHWIMTRLLRETGRLDAARRWALRAGEKDVDDISRLRADECLALTALVLGDFDAAEAAVARMHEHGSGTNIETMALAQLYFVTGRHERALDLIETRSRSVDIPEVGPLDNRQRRLLLLSARASILTGRSAEAVAQIERAFAPPNANTFSAQVEIDWLGWLTYALQSLAEPTRANTVISRARQTSESLRRHGAAGSYLTFAEATIDALSGDDGAAAAGLERAVREGWRDYWAVQKDPRWAERRNAEPFREVLDEVRTELDNLRH